MAWRNLWRHQRRTWLTVGAMVFSNVLLVFMVSLQFGSYQMMIDNTLKAYTGHIQIQRPGYLDKPRIRDSIPNILSLTEKLRTDLPGNRFAARGMAFALASSKQRSYGIQIIGVQPKYEAGVSSIPGLMTEGHYLSSMNAEQIVIGGALARNLHIKTGDELTLLGSGRDGSIAAGVVTVAGIFNSGISELDRSIAEIPLGYFQNLFDMQGQGHSITVVTRDLDNVAPLKTRLEHTLKHDPGMPEPLAVLDWDQLEPGLKQAIQADMTSAWFMYGILIILVAFSVMNTQLMSVLERTREFGIMMALGLKPARLAGLVMTETTLMAGLGLGIGLCLGLILTWYMSVAGFSYPGMEQMAERFNLPDRMYPSISLLSMSLGPGIIFIASLLAALYPSLRLWMLKPVTAMRAA